MANPITTLLGKQLEANNKNARKCLTTNFMTPLWQKQVTPIIFSSERNSGKRQVESVQYSLLDEEVQPQVVFCSPLTRALETCEIVFTETPVIVLEQIREVSSGYVCDKRRPKSELAKVAYFDSWQLILRIFPNSILNTSALKKIPRGGSKSQNTKTTLKFVLLDS